MGSEADNPLLHTIPLPTYSTYRCTLLSLELKSIHHVATIAMIFICC